MKNRALILSMILLAVSCSKTVKEIHNNSTDQVEQKASNPITQKDDVETIRKILNSDAPNVALAELLAKTVPAAKKDDLRAMLLSLSSDEIDGILKNIGKDNEAIKAQYLYYGKRYQVDSNFLENSLVNNDLRVSDVMPADDQIRLNVFTYVKNKTLDELVKTYDDRVSVLSKQIAEQIALEVALESPETAKNLENKIKTSSKDKAIEAILKAEPVLKKIDKYLKGSGLNENEQYVAVVGTGIIGGAIYTLVKDNEGFQKLLNDKKLRKDIKEMIEKGKEFMALAGALETHLRDSEKNMKALKEGIEGTQEDFREMLDTAKKTVGKPSNVHSRRIMDFFYTKVIKGKDIVSTNADPSIMSKQIRINENLDKSLKAVGNIADNLGNIVVTTEKMMALFKMKPSKDLANVLKTAKTVADTVSAVRDVTAGFAAAGPLGAFAALTSSPAVSSILGGGSDANAAQFKMINKKLNMILDNQKIMMETQIETMKMIKDLALMVDQYHQKEMQALAELRDLSIINLELQKAKLNRDIRSCERIINYQLSSVWKDVDFKYEAFYGINDLKVINSRFYSNIKSLYDVRRVVNSVEASGFETCQNGINEAFGGNSVIENPLRSLFSNSEDENLLSFQRDTYRPLLGLMYAFAETTELNSIPLHIPARNIEGVVEKVKYIRDAKNFYDGAEQLYHLEDLVSSKGLERYLGQLLILYPFLELDKNVWQESMESIVDTYLASSGTGNNQNTRSFYFLSNALRLVHSAIAQESILAGEPLLMGLHDKYFDKLFTAEACENNYIENTTSLCTIRENKLLMKNLLLLKTGVRKNYYHGDLVEEYKNAYEEGQVNKLVALLQLPLAQTSVKMTKLEERNVYQVIVRGSDKKDLEIRLPSPEQVREGNLMYSENMDHLLRMQSAVIENLEKVAPFKRIDRGENLSNLIFSSAI